MVENGNSIDELYRSISLQHELLKEHLEIGDLQAFERTVTKYFIIASASYFEEEVKNIIMKFSEQVTNKNIAIGTFIRSKVLDRGYHGLVDWKNPNPKLRAFFKIFGIESVDADLLGETDYDQAYKDFVDLGQQRNLSVHGNLAAYSSPYTLGDSHSKYESALRFLELVPKVLERTIVTA